MAASIELRHDSIILLQMRSLLSLSHAAYRGASGLQLNVRQGSEAIPMSKMFAHIKRRCIPHGTLWFAGKSYGRDLLVIQF